MFRVDFVDFYDSSIEEAAEMLQKILNEQKANGQELVAVLPIKTRYEDPLDNWNSDNGVLVVTKRD